MRNRETASETLAELLSRDIQLTTTIDLLAAQDSRVTQPLSYFIEEVDYMAITPLPTIGSTGRESRNTSQA